MRIQRADHLRQKQLRDRGRQMRREMPKAEAILWQRLRGDQLGVRFRRQLRVGEYIVDFAAPTAKLAIELDGDQHSEQIAYDQQRTDTLRSLGYEVIRFENPEVFENLLGVVDTIYNAVQQRTPKSPSPSVPLPLGTRGEGSTQRADSDG